MAAAAGDMLFAGRAATETLKKYGVETIGQLAACDRALPEQLLGKMGRQLWEYANGLDAAPVRPRYLAEPVKSVGNGTTFPQNLVKWEQIRAGLLPLCDSVATRLRRQGAVRRRRQRSGEGRGVPDGQPPDAADRAHPPDAGHLPHGAGADRPDMEAAHAGAGADSDGAVCDGGGGTPSSRWICWAARSAGRIGGRSSWRAPWTPSAASTEGAPSPSATVRRRTPYGRIAGAAAAAPAFCV